MSFHRSIAFLLLGLVSASGQEPTPAPAPPVIPPAVPAPAVALPPPGVPIPGAAPAAPAGAPAVPAAPKAALGDTKIIADINEPKLTGSALAGLYRKYTGHRVIPSAAAAAAEFSFVQEASPQDPLTFAQAAELLRKAATLENFIFVPDAEDPTLEILTFAGGGPGPKSRGVGVFNENGAVYNENSVLPVGDAVISYVMTLNFIKPAEAVNTFTQIVGQLGAFGSIAAVPNASAIVITENTSLIRRLIDLKSEIDKPGSVTGTRFIKVKYSDVTELADTLTTLLTAQASTQKTASGQRLENVAPAPGGAPQTGLVGGGGGGGEDNPVQIIPDPRTNRIVAMGRPIDLITVESLVREFDVETSEKNFLRRKLRFLTVADFLPVAEDALNRAFSGTGDSGGSSSSQGGASGGASGSRTQSSNRQSSNTGRSGSTGANFGSGSSGSSGSSFGGGSSGGSGSGGFSGGGGSSGLGDPDVNSAPESVLVGRTLLVADNITNSIVVQGPPSGLEIIERLLDQIDVKPDQVMISTVIGQITLNKTKELGFDYLLRGGDLTARGGGGFGTILPIVPVEDGTTGDGTFQPGTLEGSGLRGYGTIGDLSIYLRALQSKTDFTVLSRPSIFTSNNQKGIIRSGERIAIPTSNNNFSGGGSSTNIEYQDVVLELEVIPLVNSDNEITMEISLKNDEQNGNQVLSGAGSDGGDLTVPRISTRTVITTATVPDGQTIVLGGLIVGRTSQSKSGIPILCDIPYLGKLFSTTENLDDRSELMVFIQPSVVKNDRSLNSVQTDMDSRYKVSPKVREFADGPGVLPPADAITPVEEKESGYRPTSTRKSVPAPAPVAAPTKMKPSIRPMNRR